MELWFALVPVFAALRKSASGPGCAKTLRGINAPEILRLVATLRAKKRKNSSPLGITTKSVFVFTQPGPIADQRVHHGMSATGESRHAPPQQGFDPLRARGQKNAVVHDRMYHFSVSATMRLPKSAGEGVMADAPHDVRRISNTVRYRMLGRLLSGRLWF
jgi:hypothetical protein